MALKPNEYFKVVRNAWAIAYAFRDPEVLAAWKEEWDAFVSKLREHPLLGFVVMLIDEILKDIQD